MEKIKINCPEGYEVDKDKSTFEEIVFKVKIPEYVECINETTSYLIKGRVYKCSPKMSGKHYVLTCNLKCGGYEVGSILYAEIYDVKPSTKEAFDEQNKPKFEVGKWYKGGEWIFKYTGEKDNKIFSSFNCTPDDGYVDPVGGYFDATSNIIKKAVLLTDLSEIQKYLPDGHEDKIIKYTLEEGEYYKVVNDDFWMIGKVSEGNNDTNSLSSKIVNLRGNCYYTINSDIKYFVNKSWCYYSEYEGKVTRKFTKLSKDSDEVKWLEACNKAGKYLTKEEALKPKLPTEWEDLDDYNGYYTHGSDISKQDTNLFTSGSDNWPTREYAKASIALCKLIRLRDIYNDGWLPDWNNSKNKFIIFYYGDQIKSDIATHVQKLLSFKSKELRDEFLKNFKELIEEAKLLL